ncbi:phage baseplate protein (plasmid) [Deinococcus psychrotolerans]|uniref:Phage baseplate protein n=1 Tax=Deinococcus psychrotolerans TaxID=2489213 RepID=A0A3G8YGU0_9DEIO|nr:GPW/gp25 family protein [Deinococcus psychrotolerans]AZI44512.1 phage baseplate protein [Deinococcus psychrotolerans]
MSEHLGTGWAFPVGPDARGRVGLISGIRAVEQAILMILMTPKGQRVMRPDYGCQIHELVFAPNDASTLGLASYYVHEALTAWEPRIELTDVDADSDPAYPERIVISIKYRIRSEASEQSLVFPFYRMPADVQALR